MLGLTGANRIWFIPDIHDMRLGKYRLLASVKGVFPNPYNGDVFAFMSSDKKKLKLVRYYGHKHILWDISYDRGYKFMRPVYVEDSKEVRYQLDYKYLVALLECPVQKELIINTN